MKIAAELTSILQVLFVLSLIKKIRHSDEDLSVDFLYLNNHVNNNTIESTKKIISNFDFNSNYFDFRNNKNVNIIENKVKYDLLIVRSRVPLKSHQKFIFSKGYFALTGNCNNSKLVQNSFFYKKLYTVDDGLSNWGDVKIRYISTLLSNFNFKSLFFRKIAVIPIFFTQIISFTKFVNHFSIFSRLEKYSIRDEFVALVKNLSLYYEENHEVETLFIGIWPNFENRLSKNNKDDQFNYFSQFLLESKEINLAKKIFIKEHPKHELPINSSKYFKFEKLGNAYIEAPLEIILGCFPNLKNLYGFPSTSLFLVDIISSQDINVNLLVKKGDARYFSERADLFKGKNVRKLYI